MAFDGSGVFQRVRNWAADAAAGIKIRADLHDSEDDGFAAGLSNCITRDGQSTITQNIGFNNKRITGLGDPVNVKDAVNKSYSDGKTDLALPKAGGKMTGDLEIEKANPTIVLDSTPFGANSIQGQITGKLRWVMRLGNGETESTGNAGSNFDLHRYADDASYLGQVLNFNRATGLGTVGGHPTDPLGIATKGYVDSQVGANTSGKVNRSGDTMTGNLASAGSNAINYGGSAGSFEVRSATTHAAMSFWSQGAGFAANFGLAGDGNFYMGGWSHGGALYKFWTTRDFTGLPSGGATNFRVVYVADFAISASGTMEEPFNGAFMTGVKNFGGGFGITEFRFRQLQVYIGGTWYSVGYA